MQGAEVLLILGTCFLQLLFVTDTVLFLLAFLFGILVLFGGAILSFDVSARWRLGVSAVLCAAEPGFCLLLPVYAYVSGAKKQWWYPGIGLGLSAIGWARGNLCWQSLVLIVLGTGAAVLSAWKTNRILFLRRQLNRNMDSSREQNLLMEEKNKALREKQDYEVYTATLRERNRIAREIHDNVGHLLSRAILLTGALKAVNGQESLQVPLSDLEESLNTAMTSIRTSVHDLHDEAIDLESAAKELLETFTFCPVTLRYDMGRNLPRELKYCYLTILKEALNNVVRHSNATQVEVVMRQQPALYQLVIRDNGTGVQMKESGIGLSNMQERVKMLGGLLCIHTEKGFEIHITIPRREET